MNIFSIINEDLFIILIVN